MICLEAPNQLFASPVETERTKDEVIDLIYQWAPKWCRPRAAGCRASN